MSILTISEAKLWLRLEEYNTEEDSIIQILIDNAEVYIKDGVTNYDIKIVDTNFQNKAKLVSLILINDWYENRELTMRVIDKVKDSIHTLMLQMEHGYEVEEI